MSALDQGAGTEQSGVLSMRKPDTEAVNMVMETDKSQTTGSEIDNSLNKIPSRRTSTSRTTRKKKGAGDRAPRRPLVCIPCKKHFTRRRKLDQHNRVVHDTEVTYSCKDCHKIFSRRDNITRHMKHGKCPAHSEQPSELSVVSDDTQLLDELSMLFIYVENCCFY